MDTINSSDGQTDQTQLTTGHLEDLFTPAWCEEVRQVMEQIALIVAEAWAEIQRTWMVIYHEIFHLINRPTYYISINCRSGRTRRRSKRLIVVKGGDQRHPGLIVPV